jgi:hypothetical protein
MKSICHRSDHITPKHTRIIKPIVAAHYSFYKYTDPFSNCSAANATNIIGGGLLNQITQGTINSVIGGGRCNQINATHASVAGGVFNTASSAYSSVFGGSGSGAAFAHAGVFGQNVNAVIPNALHIEGLNISNVPILGTSPLNTIEWINLTALTPPTTRVLIWQ